MVAALTALQPRHGFSMDVVDVDADPALEARYDVLVPVLTILGMQFSFLLAGGVIIENVFFLPGLGRLVFQAIVQRDLIVVQSVVVILVFAVVTVTFLIDLAYLLINPQLRAVRSP